MKSLLFEKQLLCGNFPVHGTTCKSTKVPCDLKKLVTKHDKSWMDRTLEEVEQFRKKFSVKFSLIEFALILIQIEKGSVLITWLIPAAVLPHLDIQLQDPSYNLQWLWQEYELLGLMLDGHQFHSHGTSVVSPMNNQVSKVGKAAGFEEFLRD